MKYVWHNNLYNNLPSLYSDMQELHNAAYILQQVGTIYVYVEQAPEPDTLVCRYQIQDSSDCDLAEVTLLKE